MHIEYFIPLDTMNYNVSNIQKMYRCKLINYLKVLVGDPFFARNFGGTEISGIAQFLLLLLQCKFVSMWGGRSDCSWTAVVEL